MKRLSRFFLFLLLGIAVFYPKSEVSARSSEQDMLFATVKLYVIDKKNHDEILGSGTGLIISEYRVLTAMHVVSPVIRDSDRYDVYICVSYTEDKPPECVFAADRVGKYSETYDLAEVYISQGYDFDQKKFVPFTSFLNKYNAGDYLSPKDYVNQHTQLKVNLGEDITVLGYPSAGGEAITLTKGVVSGIQKEEIGGVDAVSDIRTDAKINHGNSGGPAFNANGELLGIAVATTKDISDIGHIMAVTPIRNFLRGPQEKIKGEICYDYGNGRKEDGKCLCNDGYEWDKKNMYCTPIAQDEKNTQANEQESDNSAPKIEEPSARESKPAEPDTEKPETIAPTTEAEAEKPEAKPVETETPSEPAKAEIVSEPSVIAPDIILILEKSLRDVILETVKTCKTATPGDLAAYRLCFKTNIKSFILEKSRAKRQLITDCRSEGAQDDDAIKACVAEKIRAGTPQLE